MSVDRENVKLEVTEKYEYILCKTLLMRRQIYIC